MMIGSEEKLRARMLAEATIVPSPKFVGGLTDKSLRRTIREGRALVKAAEAELARRRGVAA